MRGNFSFVFVDDLLLFCKAEVPLVSIFQQGLQRFATMSGLHANPSKSQLILSKSAAHMRAALLGLIDFSEGCLPLRYLGLPLLASRLTIADCKPLLKRVDERIKGWEGVNLSFAGRVQLIRSVLMALHTYWAMAFILPKGIIREVEKWLRTFLWNGHSGGLCQGSLEPDVRRKEA
ncbi:UNVERIFIED_CONTAM: hypothetical protein Slati_0894900 [Sesamum latifolium]|uniref:Reverse transcriptase domain-containing protein n=1 Tax=Sesamum latifolium TaxID=2727402 RepID=A0AAW2XNC2_9LAMI